MSFYDWMKKHIGEALLLCSASACISLLVFVIPNEKSSIPNDKHVSQPSATQSTPADVAQTAVTKEIATDCDAQNSSTRCTQLRMAKAAEQQADYACYGLILLGLTLCAAIWAAAAAHAAAATGKNMLVEAKKTANITRDVGQAQVRAYLVPENVFVSFAESSCPKYHFTVTNCGNSPARDVEISVSTDYSLKHIPERISESPTGCVTMAVGALRPGETTSEIDLHDGTIVVNDETKRALEQKPLLFLTAYIELSYVDVFDGCPSERFDFFGLIKKFGPEDRTKLASHHEFRIDLPQNPNSAKKP